MLTIKFYFVLSILFPISIAKYSPKIIEGEDAKEGQFPFMISLKRYEDNVHHCGGSILTKRWVLTAGHCYFTRDNINSQFVFAGTILLNGTGEKHGFDEYIIHEGYAPDVFEDDLCLIKIRGEFQFNERIQPIVLPVQDWFIDDGQLANVTGWGRIISADVTPPNTLQVGYNFVVLSNEHCHNLTNEIMYDGYLCAQGIHGDQAICFGDSGSPLHINGIQIGIVSFLKTSFCEGSVAEFYTRVPKYVNWIKEKLGSDAKFLKFVN